MSYFTNTNIKDIRCIILKIQEGSQTEQELIKYLKKYDILKQNFTYCSDIELLSESEQIIWNKFNNNTKSLLLMFAEIFGIKIESYKYIMHFLNDIEILIKCSDNNIFFEEYKWGYGTSSDTGFRDGKEVFNLAKKELHNCREKRTMQYNTRIINYLKDIFTDLNNHNMFESTYFNFDYCIDCVYCANCINDCKMPIDIKMSHSSRNCESFSNTCDWFRYEDTKNLFRRDPTTNYEECYLAQEYMLVEIDNVQVQYQYQYHHFKLIEPPHERVFNHNLIYYDKGVYRPIKNLKKLKILDDKNIKLNEHLK